MSTDNKLKSSFFLFAGESSADMHGGRLLKQLKMIFPEMQAFGVAGPEMRRQGMLSLIDMEDFQVMGFVDVALALPKLRRHFKMLCQHLLEKPPAVVILIDYPGFNLRLARALRKQGYHGKIIYYISPSVWAWQKKRVYILEKYVDLLLTIYPFEAHCYQNTKLKVSFVGNPLKEYISEHPYQENWKNIVKIPAARPIVALFPGSRPGEIYRNFPLQLQAAEMLALEKTEPVFAVSCSCIRQKEILLSFLKKSQLKHGQNLFIVPKEFNYELMRDAHVAVAKSGTVTLELALHQCPTVVVYNLSWLNKFIAKHLLQINLPHYCIVNILGGTTIFPELIGNSISPFKVYEQLHLLEGDHVARQKSISGCHSIGVALQETHSSKCAAHAIYSELSHA